MSSPGLRSMQIKFVNILTYFQILSRFTGLLFTLWFIPHINILCGVELFTFGFIFTYSSNLKWHLDLTVQYKSWHLKNQNAHQICQRNIRKLP